MQKRAIKTKESILDAAIALFSKSGFHGTKIDDIASAANANKQRIYHYYGNKEALFRQVVQKAYESIFAADKDLLKLTEEDIPDLSRLVIAHYFKYHRKNPAFRRILSWCNLESKTLDHPMQTLESDSLKHLRSLYNRAQKIGIFSEACSFEAYLETIFAVSFFYFSNQQTMDSVLNMNLAHAKVQERMMNEMIEIIQPEQPLPRHT
jgi:AcrR family transcriptional regulator